MVFFVISLLVCPEVVSDTLSIYHIIPPEAGQGWKLEVFDLSEQIPDHYHRLQKQFILVTEGKLQTFYGNKETSLLQSGELTLIDPGVVHCLTPEGKARFIAIAIPGFTYPEDVYFDQPGAIEKWTSPKADFLPLLDPKYFGEKIDLGDYVVYEIISGTMAGEKWSAALIEIHDSPRHFHRIEKELFIVVAGSLDIEIDGQNQILQVGEFVMITPEKIHQLKSASAIPVRVLCFSFPAFSASDMYFV